MEQFLTHDEWLARWRTGLVPLQGNYLGFYSSIVDGYVREPWAFWVPVDDHIVHRGDGVFEAVRVINNGIFDLDSHLKRLENSATQISLNLPMSLSEIKHRCVTLCRLGKESEGILRIYVSRGPGGFSPNPYESKKSILYIALTSFKALPGKNYEEGVRAGVSRVPGKRPFEAAIKSCNYLQNVLQKKDAVDRGLDFTVALNEHGEVLEGATESFFILTKMNELLIPSTSMTLAGTTMKVVAHLARQSNLIVREAKFKSRDVELAREVAFVGTTLGVLPVTTWDGEPVGDGRVGEIAANLGRSLHETMLSDSHYRTEFK